MHTVATQGTKAAADVMGPIGEVAAAVDPAAGVLKNYLEGNNTGVALSMAGPLLGIAGGEIGGVAKAFGFKSFARAGSIVGGELEGGGSALVGFSRSGSELGVHVSFVTGPAGTLAKVEQGAVNAAASQGASSVKISAAMVKDSVGRLLRRNGFTQQMKNGKGTGNWSKTIKIKGEQ